MPEALILGCSHAAGALMHEDPEYGAQNSYPMLLASMLGYTPHNHAISGGSNDAMYRIYAEQEQQYELIIACWTGMDRGEYFHPTHQQWVPINYGEGDSYVRKPSKHLLQGMTVGVEIDDKQMYEHYGKQWLAIEGNEQRGFNNKVKNILALNSLAKSKDTLVINLESFAGIHHKFPWPKDIYFPCAGFKNEFCNYCDFKNFPTEPRGHYFYSAHLTYSEYILGKIDQLGGLPI